MKITEERQDVLIGGAQSVDAFTIKASAKAFQILSSNLYSNPLGSMIRELSTNAYDAHVMTDKVDEPFLVTLPNSLEPTFKIRDFGPGLSHNDIMNVYTTFFESTKTDSNDVVGCLGLGSKSPFGVADSFTVTSFFNGTKTVYSAFLNDARIPSIAKFLEVETDEENGIEIEVAISEDDFRVFNKEVNKQLKYFKVKPIIQGSSDFEWHPDEEYLYEGTNWKMIKGDDSPRVVQGQISYPIDIYSMGKVYDKASDVVKELLQRGILFEVPIGDVNIAPSREALSYDERTSTNIVKAAEKILEELPPMIKKAIEDAPNEYAARLKYDEVMSTFGRGYYHRALSKYIAESGEATWKGKDVSSKAIPVKGPDVKGATRFTKHYNGRWQKTAYSANGDWKADIKDKTWDFEARDLKNTVWVYSTEDDKAVEGRSKQYVGEKYGKDIALIIIKANITARQLANRLGFSVKNLVIAADLPKVKRTTNTTTSASGKRELNVAKFYDGYSSTKSDQWSTETVEKLTDLEGYYVNLDRYDVEKPDGKYASDFKAVVKGAIELGLITDKDQVFGLRKANQKRNHNLVNLFDHITAEAPNLKLHTKYEYGDSQVVSKLSSNLREAKEIRKSLADDSPAKEMIDALAANTETEYGNYARRLINDMGLQAQTIDMSHLSEKMDDLYPMITQTSYYFNATTIANYIVQMDMLRTLLEAQSAE